MRTWTDEQLIEAVASSYSFASTIRKIGLRVTGANYNTVKQSIKRLNLSTTHWTGMAHLRGKQHDWTAKIPLADILVENSTYTSMHCLKKRLRKELGLGTCCGVCGITGEWNGKPLELQIDHVNGNHFDHRIENIRFVCPNCHSQTANFAGKNKGK